MNNYNKKNHHQIKVKYCQVPIQLYSYQDRRINETELSVLKYIMIYLGMMVG